MKISILTSIILLSFFIMKSQDYDLLVTTDKDSLACHIDSITNTYIYVEMRHNYNWIHTGFKKEDVIEYKKNAVDKRKFDFKTGTSYIETPKVIDAYRHAHRLIFGPTGFPLEKGKAYWTTNFGLIHDIQYALSDNFYAAFGTSILFVPAYLQIHAPFRISDKSRISFGDLFLIDTYGEPPKPYFNLIYAMYTYGSIENNISIGVGYNAAFDSWLTDKGNSPAFTLSTHLKIGKRAFFMTEQYFTYFIIDHDAQYCYSPDNCSVYYYETKSNIQLGLTGIRLATKKNPKISWQFAVLHNFLINEKPPPEYTGQGWYLDKYDELEFIALPIIGFSWKFGK